MQLTRAEPHIQTSLVVFDWGCLIDNVYCNVGSCGCRRFGFPSTPYHCWHSITQVNTTHSNPSYLIVVIPFTRAGFLDPKFYTQKEWVKSLSSHQVARLCHKQHDVQQRRLARPRASHHWQVHRAQQRRGERGEDCVFLLQLPFSFLHFVDYSCPIGNDSSWF